MTSESGNAGAPPSETQISFRVLIAHSIALGLFTGLFGVAFLVGVEFLTDLIWGDDPMEEGWFTGDVWSIVIPIAAGVVIGVIYQVFGLPNRYPGFIEDLQEGHVDPKTTVGAIVIAVFSLISGPSVGPEAPLGAAGGAAGTWAARRRGADESGVRRMTFIGISGAFGGLLSTPIGGPLLAFELEHDQTHSYYYTNIVPGVIAGSVSFGVMWPLIGAPFEGLLALPSSEFESWMLLAAVGLGVVGALAAVVVGKLMVGSARILRTFDDRPIVRGVIAGVAVGVISFTLPLTMFSGQTGLPIVLDNWESFAIPMLIALGLFKALALGISLGGGFFGGPIFPMFFIGAVLGVTVHALIPAIPLAVAVGCVMAALGAAVALLPLSMAIFAAIMTQSGLEIFGTVALASITAYALRIAMTRTRQGDMQKTAVGEKAQTADASA